MRILLTIGVVVGALLVPWSSLPLSWVGDSTGSAIEASTSRRAKAPVARLSPALGILPLSSDPTETVANTSGRTGGEQVVGRRAVEGSSRSRSVPLVPEATAAPPGVHCENGVCTIEPSQLAESPPVPVSILTHKRAESRQAETRSGSRADSTAAELTWQAARERLEELEATQFRLETGLRRGEFRFSCSVPLGDQLRGSRQFTATASADMEAVARVLEQIEAWRQTRR